MNKKEAIEHLKRIIEFYKVGDPENFDYTDKDLISIKNVLEILDKATKYIEDNVAVYGFGNKALPHWEFDDNNIQDLLKILKGEENESN